MKTKITFAMTFLTSVITIFTVKAQEDIINLIAFKYNDQSQTSEVIKWNVDTPELFTSTPTNVTSILIGTSIFNANTGDYIARVTQNDNASGIFKYNINTQDTNFNVAASFFNGSAECDMQTGLIYTYAGNEQDQVELNKYNPQSNETTVIGTFDFLPNTVFFPDGSCFDSNLEIYYFVIQDSEGKKIVSVPVNDSTFTYTTKLLTGLPITGNIGLEYSNETNAIYCIYSSYNPQNETNTFVVGSIDDLGTISVLNTIDTISGYQFYNRTFDQNTKKLLFVAYDLDFLAPNLYLYDIDTNTYETKALPVNIVVEIECNNLAYSERKYGQLSTPTFNASDLIIYQNQADKTILFSQDMGKAKFQIVNIQGATVLSGLVNNSNAIDATTLQSGIYIVSVEMNSKRVDKKLILK